VQAGGVRVAYRTWGPAQAPPVVLLHAVGEASRDWAPVAEALAPSWRVYAPDLRGHGASDWPGSYTIELIPDCELVTIPAGHLVHAARPAEFTAAVTGFLRAPLS
jgi:pimeloyl-ACP methyl ester carboxylesterase